MGLLFVESLPGPKMFRCKYCRVHSASPDAILSKDFRGRHGRAYLFDSVSLPGNNITGGIPEQFGNLSRLTSLDLEDNLFSVAVHRNLLRLIGFCTTQTERLLVYPFMQNLSVAYRLRGSM